MKQPGQNISYDVKQPPLVLCGSIESRISNHHRADPEQIATEIAE